MLRNLKNKTIVKKKMYLSDFYKIYTESNISLFSNFAIYISIIKEKIILWVEFHILRNLKIPQIQN